MVDVAPFPALRYDPAVAGDASATSAPAYDDLEPLAFAAHRTASPYTVLELLVAGGDAAAPGSSAYAAAGATYRRWLRTGVLRAEPRPALYRYEQHELVGGVPRVVRGLLGALALAPLSPGGPVLAHEDVDPARVAARVARLDAVPVDVAPVVALARLPGAVRDVLAAPPATPPLVAFSDTAGVDHRVWALGDPTAIAAVRAALADVQVVLADGHHRYAAALARRGAGGGAGDDAASRTLVYLTDVAVDGLRLCAVHRLVRGLPADALERLRDDVAVTPVDGDARALSARVAAERGPGVLGLHLGSGASVLLAARDVGALAARLPAARSATWRRLDTALLEHALLPRLGVAAVEPRGDVAAAAAEAEGATDTGVFVLRPVDVATVMALARAGERMPAKTTSFRPKPRSGLVLRPLEDVEASTLA